MIQNVQFSNAYSSYCSPKSNSLKKAAFGKNAVNTAGFMVEETKDLLKRQFAAKGIEIAFKETQRAQNTLTNLGQPVPIFTLQIIDQKTGAPVGFIQDDIPRLFDSTKNTESAAYNDLKEFVREKLSAIPPVRIQ